MRRKIIFVSAEVFSYSRTRGRVDVNRALLLALQKFGLDIRVIIPKFRCTAKTGRKIQSLKIDLNLSGFNEKVNQDGTIQVENQLGKGVFIYVHLPLQNSPD
jgi:glycogen synthase